MAQLSDLHVRGAGSRHVREFDARAVDCIAALNRLNPDIVIITGDLTDTGAEEEYRRLREHLRGLAARHYVLPGNHDDTQALRAVFSDCAYLFENDGHLSYAIDAGDVSIAALDSTKRRRPGGYLDDARLAWLDAQLHRSNRPTIVALHQPPFAAGVWPMDWLGFQGRRELESIVRSHPHVRRIISGHVHCARAAYWAGTFACTSPSTRSQHLLVEAEHKLPKLRLEPAGFLVHSLDGGADFLTTLHRLDGSIRPLAP